MNELALFPGTGGGLLASRLRRRRIVCAVEINARSRECLFQRQREGHLDRFPIWDDIRTFDGRPWRGIAQVVSGGFPCQAFSSAARGANCAVDFWPEMLRVVADAAPLYVDAENVSRRAIDRAAHDLEALGYVTKCIALAASDLGADHIRKRYWLFAYAYSYRKLHLQEHAKMAELSGIHSSIWESYPDESRVADGLSDRMDRLEATGNGQVPLVAATAWEILYNQIT